MQESNPAAVLPIMQMQEADGLLVQQMADIIQHETCIADQFFKQCYGVLIAYGCCQNCPAAALRMTTLMVAELRQQPDQLMNATCTAHDTLVISMLSGSIHLS